MKESIYKKITRLIVQKKNQLKTYKKDYNTSMEVHNHLKAYAITIKAQMLDKEIETLQKLIK